MPLYRRLPKRGFNPVNKINLATISLTNLERFIQTNKINLDQKINISILKKHKVFRKTVNKFKILSNGEIKSKINIEADFSSKLAKEKIEKAGGQVAIKNQIK